MNDGHIRPIDHSLCYLWDNLINLRTKSKSEVSLCIFTRSKDKKNDKNLQSGVVWGS